MHLYVIYTGKTQPIFLSDYIYWEKHEIGIEIMRARTALDLIGTHNFSSFPGVQNVLQKILARTVTQY